MNKTGFSVALIVGLLMHVSAGAILDEHGLATPQPKTPVEPVRPDVACDLKLVAANVNLASAQGMDKYTFEGECQLPLATYEQAKAIANGGSGKALTAKLKVRVQAEWFERMHRGSELVQVLSPDWIKKFPVMATPFSTWATCDKDPFVQKSASCKDQGVGGDKFAPYIDLNDVPLAKGKATPAQAQALSPVPVPDVAFVTPTEGQFFGIGQSVTYKANVLPDGTAQGWVCCDVQASSKVNGSWQDGPVVKWSDLQMGKTKTYADFNTKGYKRIRARVYKADGSVGKWSNWVNYTIALGK